MANPLMLHYASSRGRENGDHGGMQNNRMEHGGMRNNYDQPGMAYSNGGEMRQPNQYTTRNEYEGGAESRYRGRDGRWKSGTRRSEYEGGMNAYGGDMREHDEHRMGGDDDEEGRKYKIEVLPSKNVVDWPYSTPERHESRRNARQIGFGAMNTMGSGDRMNEHMQRGHSGMEPMEFDRETAENWVRNMRNEDKAHPVGGKWSPDMLKPLAMKYGIPTDGARFWEFYAMANAMYSDYGEVARKFGITSPEFYACMARAWMDDADAEPDKTALYYEYIVKKE